MAYTTETSPGSPSSKQQGTYPSCPSGEAYDELEMNVTAADLDPYTSRPWPDQKTSRLFNDFAHRAPGKDTPDFPKTPTKKEIPVETVGEESGVSSRGMWVRS